MMNEEHLLKLRSTLFFFFKLRKIDWPLIMFNEFYVRSVLRISHTPTDSSLYGKGLLHHWFYLILDKRHVSIIIIIIFISSTRSLYEQWPSTI